MRMTPLLLVLILAAPMRAQAPPGAAPGPATEGRRHAPLNYFFRSLLLPGWGQASLDRKLTGGLFIAFEGVALGMALKAHHEIGFLERTNSERLADKRAEREDWLVLLAANHLFSGLEAFVSANLFDFPGDLRVRRMNDGRTGMGLSLPMPR
ncbi:MAG: hypothetical protein U0974_10155 [Gemmatimonadales bacterium]|nr:hypothetical protein [Gemmatimonadales bacterium]MDZ4390079.1 hypothetical protein [Gemmatimonadales bacterium]